jgi:hypothetical protein
MRETCPTCNGSGGIYPPGADPFDRSVKKVTDDRCGGLGEIDMASDTDTIAEEREDLAPDERAVIGALTDELRSIEEVARAAGVSTAVADRVLPIAEMAGIAITDRNSSHHIPPTYRRRPQSPYWKGGRA